MKFLIGVDDTDNLESRGTGHRVRMLADGLSANRLGEPQSITRHQLLVDPQIPYTSHNSSACVLIKANDADKVWNFSREFLLRESASGSDAGLCLAQWSSVNADVAAFAGRAKLEVLTMLEARETASKSGIRCEGLTGTGGGIIGALAAVGLRYAGNDGRFLWLPGLRELEGKYSVSDLVAAHIDYVCTLDGVQLHPETLVDVGEWIRPILKNGKATLYVEEKNHEWVVISKDRIKSLSD